MSANSKALLCTLRPQFLLEGKQADFVLALEKGHFLYFDAILVEKRDGNLVPGEEFEVESRFRTPEGSSLNMDWVYFLQNPEVLGRPARIEDRTGSNGSIRFKTRVPQNAEPTRLTGFGVTPLPIDSRPDSDFRELKPSRHLS